MGRHWSSEEKRKVSTLRETAREARELIQNASHLQKPHGCQKDKRRVLSNENEQYLTLDLNQLTLQLFLKEIEKQLEE